MRVCVFVLKELKTGCFEHAPAPAHTPERTRARPHLPDDVLARVQLRVRQAQRAQAGLAVLLHVLHLKQAARSIGEGRVSSQASGG